MSDQPRASVVEEIAASEETCSEAGKPRGAVEAPLVDAARAGAATALFPVAEKFLSINGEGLAAGCPAAFIRFQGCNLHCAWCDTQWATTSVEPGASSVSWESAASLAEWVQQAGVTAATLTGGEPLLQPELARLVTLLLAQEDPHALRVEIETNGAVALDELALLRRYASEQGLPGTLVFALDCKLPGAGAAATRAMIPENYDLLHPGDAVKFVVASEEDLDQARAVVEQYDLAARCAVLVSPVWDAISPAAVVDYLLEHHLIRWRLSLQLHKIIWPGVDKGV